MRIRCRRAVTPILPVCLALGLASMSLLADSIAVRHPEGVIHGFLVSSATDGRHLADADLTQTVADGRVTSRAVFRFKDGSLQDETAVFSQDRFFRLISYRLIQKGPTFPQQMDMTIDRPQGHVVVRYSEAHGKPHVEDTQMDLPEDLVDGIIPIVLKNLRPDDVPVTLPLLVATPKPRLVNLKVSAVGEEPLSIGGAQHRATHFLLKVDIGGLSGWLAPLVGKQPPDSHLWILDGEAPTFLKSESPLYVGGPMWRIELSSPRPANSARD